MVRKNIIKNIGKRAGIIKGERERKAIVSTMSFRLSIITLVILISSPVFVSAGTPTYTGCVNVTGMGTLPKGMMYNIKEGTAPSAPCKSGDIIANFSAGDITGVIAGSGLSGGGQSNNVTLSVRTGGITNSMLASNSVTGDKIANGTIGSYDLSNGTALAEIKDNDGSGSGLDADMLDGKHASSFSSSSHNHDDRYAKNNQSCSIGKVVTGIDKSGNLICGSSSDTGALEARVAKLESLLANVTRSGDDIYIDKANVHITSGSGKTDGTVNGLGNLIIGYNEKRGSGDYRTGSHNLIIGKGNNYKGYGGLVAGYVNEISGAYSSVSGGEGNTASSDYSSISGGYYNEAIGTGSSVSGGYYNTAGIEYASVSGGAFNNASGVSSSVSGGEGNIASGYTSSVTGGQWNGALGDYSSVGGGLERQVSDMNNWRAGDLFTTG